MTDTTDVRGTGDTREDQPGAAPGAELDGLLCFDLYAASRSVTAMYRPVLLEIGLTYPQYLVLTVLWEREACTISYLARALRLDHGTLTPLLRRMEETGLLTRSRDDADERVVTVRLAAAGADLQRHQHDIHCRIAAGIGLSDLDVEHLQRVLRTISGRDA